MLFQLAVLYLAGLSHGLEAVVVCATVTINLMVFMYIIWLLIVISRTKDDSQSNGIYTNLAPWIIWTNILASIMRVTVMGRLVTRLCVNVFDSVDIFVVFAGLVFTMFEVVVIILGLWIILCYHGYHGYIPGIQDTMKDNTLEIECRYDRERSDSEFALVRRIHVVVKPTNQLNALGLL